jgi:predicted anti-sigma-YlaC factor YlaD
LKLGVVVDNASSVISGCPSDDIAAYLDGELDSDVASRFETHIRECSECSAELLDQRRLLLNIDMAVKNDPSLALPKDFAQVVAVRAQSDMSGVRRPSESKLAFKLTLILAALAFALLAGATANENPLRPVFRTIRAGIAFVGFGLRSAFDGVITAVRTIVGYTVYESHPTAVLALIVFVTALALLPYLIIRFHRARIVG